jgi:CDP-glucose 4,6-dehydratase
VEKMDDLRSVFGVGTKTCFVTGGTGLLGTTLIEKLLEMGVRVVALVRDKVPMSRFWLESDLFRDVIVVIGDVLDRDTVRRVLFEYDVDVTFHLAAQTIVGIALKDPMTTLDVNVRGTFNILEAFREYCGRVDSRPVLVVASSDKAYGIMSGDFYDEETPLRGRFPYDVSKSCADLIAQSYAVTYDLDIGVTRCGNFFGPGDLNGSRLIPSVILSLLQDRDPVLRSDGTHVRDYIFTEDGADGYILLAAALRESRVRRERCCFNFSYSESRTVLDVTHTILELMGSSRRPVIKNIVEKEIPNQHMNNGRAVEELGWNPRVGFINGLKQTIEWYRRYSHLIRIPIEQ